MNFFKGIIYTIISAFVFGFTPILAKFTYEGGNNAITLTFLRALFGIPFLFIGMRKNQTPMKISKKEFLHLIVLSFLGIGITTTSLYASYNYISVGMATTIQHEPVVLGAGHDEDGHEGIGGVDQCAHLLGMNLEGPQRRVPRRVSQR